MPDVMEYKCPACGGVMEFDSKTQKMKCPYCDTEMEVEAFREMQEQSAREKASADSTKEDAWQTKENRQWQEGEADGIRIYACESCGGEIAAEESTGATTCPFCGNRVVIKGKFSDDLKPDYIIPFKLDKKAAKNAYYNHLKGKAFLPKVFKDENHIDEIKGVYVPFWLFDVDANADVTYHAESVSVSRRGNKEYTETRHYMVHRAGNMSFDHIPADGSQKMDDSLMEAIEPFDFSQAVPFQTAYLAGYVADRYVVTREECAERAKERVKQSAQDALRQTVAGYSSVIPNKSYVGVERVHSNYVLYPVWLLNTTWKGERFIFAMNGQNGKMVGDLPADNGAFWRFVLLGGAGAGLVINLVMWLIKLL